ncbi:MAG: hypothetical protein WBE85_11110 [Methylocella sp.]
MDEAWSYVAKTQARVTPEDGTDKGDQYVFLACRSCEGSPELPRGKLARDPGNAG